MSTLLTEQIENANRLNQISEQVLEERGRWANMKIRAELLHVAEQLQAAARIALHSSDTWGQAWSEAGLLTLSKYVVLRKMIEHVS